MQQSGRTLKLGLLSAGVIVALGLGALVVPAHAAPPYGSPGYLNNWTDDGSGAKKKRKKRVCVAATNYSLRSRVSEQGYINVYLGGIIGRSGNVEVRATRDGKVYLLEVDICNGKVESETYLRGAVNGR